MIPVESTFPMIVLLVSRCMVNWEGIKSSKLERNAIEARWLLDDVCARGLKPLRNERRDA